MWHFIKLSFSVALHKLKEVNTLNDLIKGRIFQGRPQKNENFRVRVYLIDHPFCLQMRKLGDQRG